MTKRAVVKGDPLTTQANVQGKKTHRGEGGGGPVGNSKATIHGGAGALKRLREGQDFIGMAHDTQERIKAELIASGPGELIRRDAMGLQTCTDLYFDAIIAAFEKGELDQANAYIKVYGWLVSSSLRAWLAVRAIDKEGSRTNVIDYLKGGNNGED
jgi:hypothetical protein